jgi:hypothetical protein
MKLKLSYTDKTDIPEKFLELFEEKDGAWNFVGVEGIKTAADVSAVQEALRKEKADHKKTKTEITTKYGDLDPEEIQADKDKIAELEIQLEAKGGKLDETKIEELVERRLKTKILPIERERDKLKETNAKLTGDVQTLVGTISKSKIESHIRKAADAAKIVGTAIEDVIAIGGNLFDVSEDGNVVAKENVGIQPGLTPDIWLTDQKEKRPHWWPASTGGGAGGGKGGAGGGSNPWSKEGWNITAQGAYVTAHGVEKANSMAAQANSKVGATKPFVATQH